MNVYMYHNICTYMHIYMYIQGLWCGVECWGVSWDVAVASRVGIDAEREGGEVQEEAVLAGCCQVCHASDRAWVGRIGRLERAE